MTQSRVAAWELLCASPAPVTIVAQVSAALGSMDLAVLFTGHPAAAKITSPLEPALVCSGQMGRDQMTSSLCHGSYDRCHATQADIFGSFGSMGGSGGGGGWGG